MAPLPADSGAIAEEAVWKEESFVAVDLETTGTDIKTAAIVEVAAVRFKRGVQEASFRSLVALPDGCELPSEATAVHGITPDQLRDSPSAQDALTALVQFVRENAENPIHVVGHNILSFDLPIILSNASRCGLSQPLIEEIKSWRAVDTLRLARDPSRLKNASLKSHKLVDLCEVLCIDVGRAHSARDDAAAAGTLLLALRRPEESLADLVVACTVPRLLAEMPWGKHKGVPFDRLEPESLVWIVRNVVHRI